MSKQIVFMSEKGKTDLVFCPITGLYTKNKYDQKCEV